MRRILPGLLVFVWLAPVALAFNGQIAKEDPVVLTVGEIQTVTEYDAPRDVPVSVKNTGKAPLAVRLEVKDLVDEWRVVGEAKAPLTVAPDEETTAVFRIAAGKGACSALYPVHVYATFERDGRETTARAVQIFKTDFTARAAPSSAPASMPVAVVPSRGALALSGLKTQRVAWAYYDRPLVYKPVGWEGADPQSSASFGRQKVARGEEKRAIQMHPAWKGGGGPVFAEYLLRLPASTTVTLMFANAIRDNTPKEPASDGVTFRVWAGEDKLFERHTDAKVWAPAEVDLSRFAGKDILLRLESHPGPNRNTVCDSSFWGDPTVFAGSPAPLVSAAEKRRIIDRARQAVAAGKAKSEDIFVFDLEDGNVAAVVLGPNGLADGAMAFGSKEHCVALDGLRVSVLGNEVGGWPSQIVMKNMKSSGEASGRVRVTHRLALDDKEFDLLAEIWKEGPGLRVKVSCPERVTDIAPGPADQKAPRVYYGHGYCIVEPKTFKANAGGHNLSTSHVGFDFANGVSLLMASSTPPDSLEVDPDRRVYALHAHTDTTMTFVPSQEGAFDCAIKYRPLYDKKPAGGVQRKAGRFVFDVWGGRYAEIADTMERAFAYGLTDSMLLIHTWQRWGYDYRLPDVYPPNPQMGTLEDLQRAGRVCAARDVPWGLHDNYIDFYPDATGYSYDRICFTEQGAPIEAWINLGRDAQSYRWRPDQFMPFLQRNLRFIKENLKPTAYFVDVFSASGGFEYTDRRGAFHPKTETLRCWGEAFAYIRDYLGGNAPTSSEAGGDHLIGYLDGGDCQHLQLSPQPLQHYSRVDCGDWERAPWFDAVNHARFILHGVGYSVRYQGERSRRFHGIESDDYISDEILLGHALMTDWGARARGAVRKYWLAQDFARSVALDEITNVEFADGDIHRPIVSWKSGARVWVNRGEKDWVVESRTLPQYGYLAKSGPIESSIEKIQNAIVEQSRAPERFYVNGRGFDPDAPHRITPSAGRVEYLGGRKFKLAVNWNAEAPAPKDLNVFVHFTVPTPSRLKQMSFQSGVTPKPGTSVWKGSVTTGADEEIEIPENCLPGRYNILVGMVDPKTKKRMSLPGEEFDTMRYRIGVLIVEGSKNGITGARLDTSDIRPPEPSRFNVAKVPVDFGPAIATGAFRCEMKPGRIILTPLPDGDSFRVTLRLDRLAPGTTQARSVEAIDAEGKNLRDIPFEIRESLATFQTAAGDFAYSVSF